ncbi:restriction endonuclease subunit S, partial [Mycoplasma sp. CSL7475-4]|uniref:restriction endonuclease subunit S n=1 Tax=Mycoplasma sp. CSL7475-4 TaxID=2973942 RepID=UPI00216B2729|nr:restriction endonuclease subunit S [Mycoplasma sp. CSL7475-4]
MVMNDKTMDGNIIGKVLHIDKYDKYIYNQRTQRLIINEIEYLSKFIYYLMYSPHTRNKILSIKQGTSQLYINWSQTVNLSLKITKNKQEQNYIYNLFDNVKTIISLLQRKLEKLENIKNTLLEKMFASAKSSYPAIRFKGFTNAW